MPEEEAEVWLGWGTNVFGAARPGDPPVQDKADALVAYVTDKTDNAARYPGSLFDALSRVTVEGRPLTRDERLGVAHISFSGGRDTVIDLLAGIVALYAQDPAAMAAIRKDPSLAPSATEELLRYISPLRLLARTCPHGGEAGGHPVAPGSGWECAMAAPTAIRPCLPTLTQSGLTASRIRIWPSAAGRMPASGMPMPGSSRGRC